jgi:predicted nucleic acid-binding protein
MTAAFADTFYWLALVNPADSAHARVIQFATRYKGPLVTTRFVLLETAAGLAKPDLRPLFLTLYRQLLGNRKVRIEPCSDELFHAGFDLYARRPDKGWSLTDCTSFVVMGRDGLTDALTGDHHFAQAGFTPLLAP